METLKSNSISNITKKVDQSIMKMGKNLLYHSRFGLGQNKVNISEYLQLQILKDSLCMPTCEHEGKIMEIISKKLNNNNL